MNQLFEPISEKAIMSIKLIKQIGRGGFGRVFYAKLKSSDETFAMKVVDKYLLFSIFKPAPEAGKKQRRQVILNETPENCKYFLKLLSMEKEVGLLAKDCRFLVSLINTCHSRVNIIAIHLN